MKRLLWLLPALFVASLSAATSIPQQGTAALSTFLTDATARGADAASFFADYRETLAKYEKTATYVSGVKRCAEAK